eukprot:Skav228131  [mRNA]  locus=scaffold1220:369793:374005:+ [translate_table: standard]
MRSSRRAYGLVMSDEAVNLAFFCRAETWFGQHLRVVGSIPELGNWNPALGLELAPVTPKFGIMDLSAPRLTEGRSRKTSFSDEVDEYVCSSAEMTCKAMLQQRSHR